MSFTNRWIADRGYGTGMALAFEGDPEFIRRSVNFAATFLLSDSAHVKEQSPSFVIVNTTMTKLMEALTFEGYLAKMLELRKEHSKNVVSEIDLLDEDDLPADINEQCRRYTEASFSARDFKEAKAAEELDPFRGLNKDDPVLLAKWEAEAIKFSKEYADKEIAKLHFEDFMRHVSRAPVHTHSIESVSFGGMPAEKS